MTKSSRQTMMRTTLVAASLLLSTSAFAQSVYVDEFRFGGTWAQPAILDGNHPEKDQFGINGEVLFTPFDFDYRADRSEGFVRAMLTPRLHIGGTANFDTNGTNLVYTGLTWRFGLTENLFAEASFGASLNDGEESNVPGRASLGSALLFRESIALGYQFTPQMSVIWQIDHSSNADLVDKNRGLTATHLKVGYKF